MSGYAPEDPEDEGNMAGEAPVANLPVQECTVAQLLMEIKRRTSTFVYFVADNQEEPYEWVGHNGHMSQVLGGVGVLRLAVERRAKQEIKERNL